MAARDMASAEAPAHLSRMDKAFQTFKTGLFGVLLLVVPEEEQAEAAVEVRRLVCAGKTQKPRVSRAPLQWRPAV